MIRLLYTIFVKVALSFAVFSVFFGCTDSSVGNDISVRQGYSLSSPSISYSEPSGAAIAFATDSLGRIWIGKGDGLSCYNGSFYMVYGKDGAGISLPDAHIRDLFFSSEGKLWIADNSGLRYMEDGKITTVESAGNAVVMRVKEGLDGRILFTTNRGVGCYEPGADVSFFSRGGLEYTSFIDIAPSGEIWTATHYREVNRIMVLSPGMDLLEEYPLDRYVEVRDLRIMDDGTVWVLHEKGLMIFDSQSHKTLPVPEELFSLVDGQDPVFARQYTDGNVLVGLRGKGCFSYSRGKDTAVRIFPNLALPSDYYTCHVTEDGDVLLSDDLGPTIRMRGDKGFRNIISAIQPDYYSNSNEICTDASGNIWIARGKWLLGYDPSSGEVFQRISNEAGFVFVQSDGEGKLFANVGRETLIMYTLEGNRAVYSGQRSFPGRTLDRLFVTFDRTLWYGFSDHLHSVDLSGGAEKDYEVEPGSFMIQDRGNGKLYLFSPSGQYECGDSIERVSLFSGVEGRVSCLMTMSDGSKFVGTRSNGLQVVNTSGEVLHMGKDEGLPSFEIRSVIEDRSGIIWIATPDHITRYNPSTGTVRSYSCSGFSSSRPFSWNQAYIGSDGNLYFCGEGGVAMVDTSIEEEKESARFVSVEYLSVDGEVRIPVPNSLVLSHNENDLRFGFASYSEDGPIESVYSYRLEGLDHDWIYSVSPEVTYSSLRPGRYRFILRSGMAWEESEVETSIPFRIKPHPLASVPALLLYFALALMLALQLVRLYTDRKIHREQLSAAAEREKMKQDEIDYLTNLAHELRNPLTMIYGPIRQMVEKGNMPDEERNMLRVAKNAASRLRTLTDEILNISSDHEVKETLKVSMTDLSTLVSALAENYRYAFNEKGVSLQSDVPKGIKGWADEDKVYKILTNLLSNAVKYTPEGGKVAVCLSMVDDGKAAISVSDNGPGVPEGKREEIFGRFERGEADKRVEGSGVGLNYARALSEVHKGTLEYSPSSSGGSVFTLTIPVSEDAYTESEKVERTSSSEILSHVIDSRMGGDPSRKTVVVVEDNPEINLYLKYLFSGKYNVISDSDGKSAFDTLKTIIPDLVVSDLMMPGMDGMQLCAAIKEDENLRHIPVILLTAKTDDDTAVESLRGGADAFIPKPFDPSFLLASVENLIRNRERMQEKALKVVSKALAEEDSPANTSPDSSFSDRDREFLGKLSGIISDNISNAKFTIDDLAKQLFMSYSSLYASTKTLTGLTPMAFLVRNRMTKARELIEEGRLSMTEIADMVGYGSLSHFSREFKKFYGENPTSIQKKGPKNAE